VMLSVLIVIPAGNSRPPAHDGVQQALQPVGGPLGRSLRG
jgi:hypothetical protein